MNFMRLARRNVFFPSCSKPNNLNIKSRKTANLSAIFWWNGTCSIIQLYWLFHNGWGETMREIVKRKMVNSVVKRKDGKIGHFLHWGSYLSAKLFALLSLSLIDRESVIISWRGTKKIEDWKLSRFGRIIEDPYYSNWCHFCQSV